ncbi:TPA: hypothetical protein ACH3X1_012533 [Trebouxia sp. C0004]
MIETTSEYEADIDATAAETADLDLAQCYVCQKAKDGERLTQCLSATAYLKMKEVGIVKRANSDVAQAFDEMEVNVLFQSSEQGNLKEDAWLRAVATTCFTKLA